MSRTKPPARSDWKDGFLFLGNHLALDFVNTRPLMEDGPLELLPDLEALLRWFQAAELLGPGQATELKHWAGSPRAGKAVREMQEWRERLREGLLAWEAGGALHRSTVDELNRLMAKHPMRTRLRVAGGDASAEAWFEASKPDDLYAPLAHSAAQLFARPDRSRVRKCANCILHFVDTSKKGTRCWCSMQLCGNRAKVAAYAARRRGR